MGIALAAACAQSGACAERAAPAQYDAVIAKHSATTGVPEALIRRVIVRESKYNPSALHRGHYGMMQIKPATARAMGYRGAPTGLLDADTNLTYGVRYLAGAYKVAGGNHDRAVRLYASGYYYDAKRRGMLTAIGLGRDGKMKTDPAPAPATGAMAQGPAAPTPPAPPVQTQLAFAATPAAPIPPLPPIRGAASAVANVAAVPLPVARDVTPVQAVASAQPARVQPPVRAIDPKAAPVALASAAPIPRPRDLPIVTGSVTPRPAVRPQEPAKVQTAAVAPPTAPSAAAAIPMPAPRDTASIKAKGPEGQRPRVIAVDTAPALAAAGPLPSARSKTPAAPQKPAASAELRTEAPVLRR
ncbi:lytic transglycosylase domain-containing protein [Hansschlegelia zhihuaiae]|uniref:Lytic transglycosylase domain-containing protein n=1 Tax=Hansschlegelia zhihuaiae TaxID=405005 RepID=A0A4Q0MPV0_9HYPH|nr:lytic transglycosylase domain-containing protein [Hansschlegelia zhihuaiae]